MRVTVGASGPKQKDLILMTGATGALGTVLLPLLLQRRHRIVCLVRAQDSTAAHARVHAIAGHHTRLTVVRGDIVDPRCGLGETDLSHLFGRVRRIVHCAASISFDDKIAAYQANVHGLRNVLKLADDLDTWDFIHVSTAYVAGNAPMLSELDLPSPAKHQSRNHYEETKQIGEALVREWALARLGRRFTILRPSILVGREDGTSPTFDAYYGYFKPIHRIAEAIRKRAKDKKSLPQGVAVDDGWVFIPLALQASETATLNLVPIDWVATTIANLIGAPSPNEILHLVNPTPPLVRWVITTSLAHLKIQGVQIVATKAEKDQLVAAQLKVVQMLQRQVDSILDQYTPYTNHLVSFDSDRTRLALANMYQAPPELDMEFMGRLLAYACHNNWRNPASSPHEPTSPTPKWPAR
jgi:nucleoside-diphosphate-sugar epimerase